VNRAEILDLLGRHKPELQRRFGVRSVTLFGSRARDEADATSDFDVPVDFDRPATSDRHFGVQFNLEDLLGALVDLVTEKSCCREPAPSPPRRRTAARQCSRGNRSTGLAAALQTERSPVKPEAC
jgi:uncharacterized protein